jgi:hypothetical protein
MNPKISLEISPAACFLAAVLILLLPLQWWFGVLLAALVHECSHLLAIYLLGGEVLSLRIGSLGAELNLLPMPHWKELLAALAGPLAGFLAVYAMPRFPCFAAAALIQSVWNLLPVYPLDGGRILRCILLILGLSHYVQLAEKAILVLLLIAGIGISLTWDTGAVFPLCLVLAAAIGKFPCKSRRKGLQ